MELCENKSVLYSFKNLGFRKKEKLKEITKKKHERKQKTVGSPIEMRDPPNESNDFSLTIREKLHEIVMTWTPLWII